MNSDHRNQYVDRPDLLGLRPWIQLLVGLPLGLVAASVAGITQVAFAFGVYGATTWNEALLVTWPGQTIGMVFQIFAAVAVMAFVARCLARRSVYEFERKGAGREFGYGALLGGGIITSAVTVLFILGNYRVTEVDLSRGLLSGLLLGLGSAFGEEVAMRGILLRILVGKLGKLPALVITSIAFGLLHLGNPGASLLGAVGIALQAGILFGVAYLITRRLWFVIGIHAAWNFTQTAIFGLGVSGVQTEPGLFVAEIHGPDWLTGGGIGIEGSVIMIALGLMVSALLLPKMSQKH